MKYPKIAILEAEASKETVEKHGNDIMLYTEDELKAFPDSLLDDFATVVVYEPLYKLHFDVQKKLIKKALKESI